MRKLFWQINTTLDGFMEGPAHELNDTAEIQDPDFDSYASAMLQEIGTILLGRVTYQLFSGYWPTTKGPDADRLNLLPKVVFSKTLAEVQWNNTRLVHCDLFTEITALKQQTGGDIALFVTPVILGRGQPTFKNPRHRTGLELIQATSWSSGVVALHYRPTSPKDL